MFLSEEYFLTIHATHTSVDATIPVFINITTATFQPLTLQFQRTVPGYDHATGSCNLQKILQVASQIDIKFLTGGGGGMEPHFYTLG